MKKEYKSKDLSSVDWYIATYIHRFKIIGKNDNDLNKRCLAWENTILIKATNPDDAYKKAIKEAKLGCEPYTNSDGVKVKFVFEGLTSLLPIYEKLEHGSEIMWTEHNNKSIKTIKNKIKKKSELEVYS